MERWNAFKILDYGSYILRYPGRRLDAAGTGGAVYPGDGDAFSSTISRGSPMLKIKIPSHIMSGEDPIVDSEDTASTISYFATKITSLRSFGQVSPGHRWGKRAKSIDGEVADRRDRVRDVHRGERAASFEGTVADRGDRVHDPISNLIHDPIYLYHFHDGQRDGHVDVDMLDTHQPQTPHQAEFSYCSLFAASNLLFPWRTLERHQPQTPQLSHEEVRETEFSCSSLFATPTSHGLCT